MVFGLDGQVMLCFNKTAFRANRTIKIDSVDVEAYASPNMPSLATVDMAEDTLDVNLSGRFVHYRKTSDCVSYILKANRIA